MYNESDYDKAVRLKGYGACEKNWTQNQIEREKTTEDGMLKVKPTVITSVNEYLDFVKTLESSFKNPVFYRGQGNANYTVNPTVLREKPKNENKMIQDFYRHFPFEIDSCKNDMARLVLMQHFGLSTRALDISENPLASLYFTCSPMKKFNQNIEAEKKRWGEVVIFKESEKENDDTNNKLKAIQSTVVSILASSAFMDESFNLWKLGMGWKKITII
ncbi:MAG: FRG domain-containing protein [Treponema sp.]|nr:FRG domain-containing protein [Treponema sp.]